MAEREYKATQIAYQSGLSVPAVEELIEVDGRQGFVMERLDGPTMLEYMMSRPIATVVCARIMAELHADVHSRRFGGLRTLIEVVERRIKRDSEWPSPVREATLECVRQLPEGDVICHWDIHPNNIVMAKRGPIIIDWSETVLGNSLADAAMTWLLMRVSSIPARGKFSDGAFTPFTYDDTKKSTPSATKN